MKPPTPPSFMPLIRAVLFDLDNTLVDRDGAFRSWVRERFADPVVRADLVRCDDGGRGDRTALFCRWKRHAGETLTQSALGRGIARRLRPDRELIRALKRCSRRLKLGIITNGSGETQRAKIRAAGLDQVFVAERIWVSAEVGVAKPDPGFFLSASRSLGVPPAHCLVVGDSVHDDQAGALAAGMRARLVASPVTAASLADLVPLEAA